MPLMYPAFRDLADHLYREGKLSAADHTRLINKFRRDERRWWTAYFAILTAILVILVLAISPTQPCSCTDGSEYETSEYQLLDVRPGRTYNIAAGPELRSILFIFLDSHLPGGNQGCEVVTSAALHRGGRSLPVAPRWL